MSTIQEEFEEELEEIQERPFNYAYFKRLMSYLKPYRRELAVVFGMILLGTVVTLIEPLIVAWIIDDAVPRKDYAMIWLLTALGLVMRLIVWGISHLRMYRISAIGQSVLHDLRKQLFDHIQLLSLRFYDSRPVGKIMSRITSDVGTINELLNGGLTTILIEGLSLIGIIVIMLAINWQLALVSFAISPSFYFLFGKLHPKIESTWVNVRRSASNMNANLNESVNGVRVSQAFAREERNIARFEKINQWNRNINVRAVKLDNLIWPLIDFIGVAGTALLMWFGAKQVIEGTISLGIILAFINYLWRFWGPVSALSKVYSQVLSAMASAERIFEFIDTPPEVKDKPDAKAMPPVTGAVSFENVSFRYSSTDKSALNGVSLHVKAGQTVAIVGPTGAGKTTIVNLIMRFYDPTEGNVKIDGIDLRDVTLESLRSQISLVLQDPFIFSGSIGDNIRYGKLDATQEEIDVAVKAVRLDEFIDKLAEKYDYQVEERGGRLSLGQRQLVSFARALLADPRILILDEATSSVDTTTERMIQQALRVLLSGRTAFIIAHRLSTIRNADVILVMQDGKIAEQGTHTELLHKRGLYWKLVHAHEEASDKMQKVVQLRQQSAQITATN
jgi:ATP-binding cassette subfamily B protein